MLEEGVEQLLQRRLPLLARLHQAGSRQARVHLIAQIRQPTRRFIVYGATGNRRADELLYAQSEPLGVFAAHFTQPQGPAYAVRANDQNTSTPIAIVADARHD